MQKPYNALQNNGPVRLRVVALRWQPSLLRDAISQTTEGCGGCGKEAAEAEHQVFYLDLNKTSVDTFCGEPLCEGRRMTSPEPRTKTTKST